MSVAVIQGGSGGIGLALTKHLLSHTSLKVYALTHGSARGLTDKLDAGKTDDRLHVVGDVDVREERGLEDAASTISSREGKDSVRLIACFAGILHPEKSLGAIDARQALDTFAINTLGHLLTYKHMVPLVPNRKAIAKLGEGWLDGKDPAEGLIAKDKSLCFSLSARVGSIADNEKGGWYSYRSSKAALNQVIRTLDHELHNKSSSAVAIGYHPGTVLTSFTRPVIGDKPEDVSKGILSVDTAVEKVAEMMRRATHEEGYGGRCWDWKGTRVEW